MIQITHTMAASWSPMARSGLTESGTGLPFAEELSISITSMKLHQNPLSPVILLDKNRLWESVQHARSRSMRIRQEVFKQTTIEVFDTPNDRLNR
ncbi:MAG: hypothetical protein ABIJ31_10100 [Pseudomonadota bacterium]